MLGERPLGAQPGTDGIMRRTASAPAPSTELWS
jgi:hypothetical protein